jgi:hypothetical protein
VHRYGELSEDVCSLDRRGNSASRYAGLKHGGQCIELRPLTSNQLKIILNHVPSYHLSEGDEEYRKDANRHTEKDGEPC